MTKYLLYAGVTVLVFIGLRILSAPIKTLLKLLLNTALGLLSLLVFNLAGRYIGVTIGLNLFSGLVVGLCGPVGIVILLIIRLITF